MELKITSADQTLRAYQDGKLLFQYTIATAKNGLGEKMGSEMTPRSWHIVRAKIGDNCVPNTVFVARRATGEIYSSELDRAQPGRDWILTRILWLSGVEKGFNRGGDVDTMRRYIYIHGTPDSVALGEPSSHGCIRMRNKDVVELYNTVPVGTKVWIG